MSFEIPDLDDKTFDELFEEARALIPRYAPQWTDHNFSDPGVTFIDLFAWIAEMQIYYANRITPAIKKKFLKFLGITPIPAKPSTAYVTFCLRKGIESQVIPDNTLLIAADGLTGLYEPFETTETVTVTSASIAAIVYKKEKQLFDISEGYSSANGYFEPFSTGSRPVGQMLIGLKNKEQENSIRLYFDLVETDLVENMPSTPESDRTPSVNLLWKVWNGYSWNQLSVSDETCGLNHKGFVTVSGLEN